MCCRSSLADASRTSAIPLRSPLPQGFLAPGTDLTPIVPALRDIWSDARSRSMAKFNFRTVTDSFNKLVYQYPIRIPERFSLVIRSLLTQEGICMSLSPDFRFLEVAYPYVAKRLLTDTDTGLRDRLLQVLFFSGSFQWRRLENLIELATQTGEGLDMTETVVDGAKVLALDDALRNKILVAVTQDNRLHVDEVRQRLPRWDVPLYAARPGVHACGLLFALLLTPTSGSCSLGLSISCMTCQKHSLPSHPHFLLPLQVVRMLTMLQRNEGLQPDRIISKAVRCWLTRLLSTQL